MRLRAEAGRSTWSCTAVMRVTFAPADSRPSRASPAPPSPRQRARRTRPRAPRRASIEPTNRTRPLFMITAWSHTRSTSGSRCDDSTIAQPRRAGRSADQLHHLVARARIEPVGRLVEEQQLRIVHERLRELHALLHAGRVAVDRAGSACLRARRSTALRARAASPRRAAGPTARRRTCTARPRTSPRGTPRCSGM